MTTPEMKDWIKGQASAYLSGTGQMYVEWGAVRDSISDLADDAGMDRDEVWHAYPAAHLFLADD